MSAATIAPRASRSVLAVGLILALALLGGASPSASAKGKKRRPAATAVAKPRPPTSRSAPTPPSSSQSQSPSSSPSPSPDLAASRTDDAPSVAATPTSTPRTAKTKVYSFGAMDVEGKLKTPQLLYFLNRVKLELDMSAPDRRSFMKELARTADDPNL